MCDIRCSEKSCICGSRGTVLVSLLIQRTNQLYCTLYHVVSLDSHTKSCFSGLDNQRSILLDVQTWSSSIDVRVGITSYVEVAMGFSCTLALKSLLWISTASLYSLVVCADDIGGSNSRKFCEEPNIGHALVHFHYLRCTNGRQNRKQQ